MSSHSGIRVCVPCFGVSKRAILMLVSWTPASVALGPSHFQEFRETREGEILGTNRHTQGDFNAVYLLRESVP